MRCTLQTLPAVQSVRPVCPSATDPSGAGTVEVTAEALPAVLVARAIMSEPQPPGTDRDLYRDTWVRYLGEFWG